MVTKASAMSFITRHIHRDKRHFRNVFLGCQAIEIEDLNPQGDRPVASMTSMDSFRENKLILASILIFLCITAVARMLGLAPLIIYNSASTVFLARSTLYGQEALGAQLYSEPS
ncbi:hypothetical protein J6590_104779, partial [Homalodisca vitripennis]